MAREAQASAAVCPLRRACDTSAPMPQGKRAQLSPALPSPAGSLRLLENLEIAGHREFVVGQTLIDLHRLREHLENLLTVAIPPDVERPHDAATYIAVLCKDGFLGVEVLVLRIATPEYLPNRQFRHLIEVHRHRIVFGVG